MASLVFFVSAASSGFGKAISLEALARGHKVIATARNSSKIADLKEKGAVVMDLDVTQSLGELKDIVAEANNAYGKLDILINAAGYILEGALEEASPEETFQAFNTNVFGVLNLARAVLPYMREQQSGVIALFGSLGSWIGGPGAGIYCATKWCVSALAESLRPEVASFGIDVVSIEPGYFRTGFLNSSAKVSTKVQMKEYDEDAVGEMRNALSTQNNRQLGNVELGSKAIVDVLSKKGGKEIPIRLVIGSDAYGTIKQKCESTLELLEEWKEVTTSTDHVEGQ